MHTHEMSVHGYRYRVSGLLCKLELDRSAGERPFSRYSGTLLYRVPTYAPMNFVFPPLGIRAPGYSLALAGMTEHTGAAVIGPSFAVNQ